MRRIPAMAIAAAIVSCGPAGSANAQPDVDRTVALEELHAAPKPRQQSDLDTVQLAAAHRERAESLEEKTNGLWQSWLVSICQGCGAAQKAAKPIYRDNYPVQSAVPSAGPVGEAQAAAGPVQSGVPDRRKVRTSLAEDLSPGNISAIRRMPN